MRVKAMVIGTRVDKWMGKQGMKEQPLLMVMDMDREHRLDNMFDYALAEDELTKPPAVDALVELAVTHIESGFGGRLRCKGKLLPVTK